MKSRDVIIGFIFLVILIAGVLWVFRNRSNKTSATPAPSPSISQKVSNAFPSLNVPAGADRANLSDISGGQGVGVATRQKTNGSFSVTVMANLPAPSANSFYQSYLTNGSTNITLGRMSLTKSGYLVDFTSGSDLTTYNKVVVSQGSTHILEGSF
jgi:hypothetical protein